MKTQNQVKEFIETFLTLGGSFYGGPFELLLPGRNPRRYLRPDKKVDVDIGPISWDFPGRTPSRHWPPPWAYSISSLTIEIRPPSSSPPQAIDNRPDSYSTDSKDDIDVSRPLRSLRGLPIRDSMSPQRRNLQVVSADAGLQQGSIPHSS